jgi:hypothetical protein
MGGEEPRDLIEREFGYGPRHESNEIEIKGILLSALGLVVMAVAILAVLGLVMKAYERQRSHELATRPPLFTTDIQPPGPHLQGNPATDLAQLRKHELQQLNSYGWVNPEKGIAHIPIDRALDILIQSGLPKGVQSAAPGSEQFPDSANRVFYPSEAGNPADPGKGP